MKTLNSKSKIRNKSQIRNLIYALFIFFVLSFIYLLNNQGVKLYAADDPDSKKPNKPIEVNGDIVEYLPENNTVAAKGNVEVIYKGTMLTCENLTVNTETKDSLAEGRARIEDQSTVLKGNSMTYNFNSKTGVISNATFASYPYFGKNKKTERISEKEFVFRYGYLSTCSLDQPHYRLRSKKMSFFPGDKIQTRHDIFYVGKAPVAYLSKYNHSLKDPLMHVQVTPGKSKKWGPYVLTAWRYNITDYMSGRIYYDYRAKMGVAEGFGTNYNTKEYGKGDFKFYYTQERPRDLLETQPGEFQRYFARWRHQWAISERTTLTHQYFKIVDSRRMLMGTTYNVLKDYFPREYEKDTQPLTYTTLHHNFNQGTLDLIEQKRINRWYSQTEKVPEGTYTLPSTQIGETPLYFSDSVTAGNYNIKNPVPSDSWNDVSLARIDTTNKFSLPMKVSFLRVTPSAGVRNTFSDKDVGGGDTWRHPRSIFLSGADVSTNFYRLFNVNTNFLNLDINGLRHVITPTITYSYNHAPTVPGDKLKMTDSIYNSVSTANCELSNKLQTKRDNKKVDIADFRVKSTYTFQPEKPSGAYGSNFSDFIFDLELWPYSWLTFDGDATYNHYLDYFSGANYSFGFNLASERTISFGQRYSHKGSNEFTLDLNWRLTPKWKFRFYERFQLYDNGIYEKKHGFREQEYAISRDLHCWIVDFTYNVKEGEGASIWFVFKLKAFPEVEFNYNQSYHAPKPGSQSG